MDGFSHPWTCLVDFDIQSWLSLLRCPGTNMLPFLETAGTVCMNEQESCCYGGTCEPIIPCSAPNGVVP